MYLLNHISYFNKICRICCLNTRIQSLKVWLKSVLLWLIYRFFQGDCFFIGAPCTQEEQWVAFETVYLQIEHDDIAVATSQLLE